MNILVAEDDPGLRHHLVAALRSGGHEVDETEDGLTALRLLAAGGHDAAVLDIGMPGMDGVAVIRQARADGCSAIMILSTARSDVDDKIQGLDAGADDYLVKPYSTEELLARLRSAERRVSPDSTSNVLRVADLEIDIISRTACRQGTKITLTNREFALLELLANASPRPVSKASLVERVWDQYFDSSNNVVNVYINYLRRKIDLPGMKPLLHTVRGLGFSLCAKEEDP